MPFKPLSTSRIARAVGCHPNTVLLYEKWGLIARVPRAANGYRLYSDAHLDQMRLARTALDGLYPGKTIRRQAYKVIHLTVSGELESALVRAGEYLEKVKRELKRAHKAVRVVSKWVSGTKRIASRKTLPIGEVAETLELSRDKLRNWERNGLLNVPRNPLNGYRQYRQEDLDRLRVIELLLHCSFGMMAIHRMMQQVDGGDFHLLQKALDTPDQLEIVYPTDQWLTTLAEQEKRARQVQTILEEMIVKQ